MVPSEFSLLAVSQNQTALTGDHHHHHHHSDAVAAHIDHPHYHLPNQVWPLRSGDAADATAAPADSWQHNRHQQRRICPPPTQRYESDCGRPQMAHEMYQRLLSVAEKGVQRFVARDVWLAAYSGQRLVFRASTAVVATSIDDDFHGQIVV